MFRAFAPLGWLRFRNTPPDVALAQVRQLRRQIPLLYALLMLNAWAVAYTHYRFAPAWLTVGMLAVLTALCGVRTIAWMKPAKDWNTNPAQALRQMRQTTWFGGSLGGVFVTWSLVLDQYGGPLEHGHIALFVAITVIGCIFCLMHLPQAGLLVTAIVTGPYMVYYVHLREPVFIAMAINIALVSAVMVQVLLNSFSGFRMMVQSQSDLAAKQIEARRLSDENARLAHTDALTGLPNRRFFFARLDELIHERAASQARFVVGVLDLDRFKPVNDAYGHAFGDRLLADVGRRLAALANDTLIVARMGGDEFGLLMTDGCEDALATGQRICDLIAQPMEIDDIRITFGCSCGLAIFPDAGTTAHELFDRSDYALYHVKSNQRGVCAMFSIDHETLIRSERAIEAALQSTDIAREFDIHFQPIIDTTTMRVTSVEALARWHSPTMGVIAPDQFIPIAERMGMIQSITLTLLDRALEAMAVLPAGIGLSFNLSANDIASPETIRRLIARIAAAPIHPARITFEVTETALMRDFEEAATAIGALRGLGVQIALDDFGTGYSSLGYLRRLPIDRIKIDRSFVADLETPSGRNIVTAILGLCENLGLDCVIEGVENVDQLDCLREMGAVMGQGYLFARPMSLGALLNWLPGVELGGLNGGEASSGRSLRIVG